MTTYAVTTAEGDTITFESANDGNTITHAVLTRWAFNDGENLNCWAISEAIATENAEFLEARFDGMADTLAYVRVVPVRILAAYS